MNLYEKLSQIQVEMKCNKGQYNKFGNFYYRSCEDIQEAVKSYLKELKCSLMLSDEMVLIGDRYYIKATATLIDAESGEKISNTAYAREEPEKKGMDAAQITGATSSYARKYALNGLFCLDDNKDADSMDNTHNGVKQSEYKCEKCGIPFTDFEWKGKKYTAKDGYEIAKKNCNGVALCNRCRKSGA